MINTTVHIDESLRVSLYYIAHATGSSLTSIIVTLLKKNAYHHTGHSRAWIRIRYQRRQKGRIWTRIHVRLSPAEYEFILDLRRVYKRSVSSLIACSADKYLNDLKETHTSTSDNYHINAYSLSTVIIDGVTCHIQMWGIPETIQLFQPTIHNIR